MKRANAVIKPEEKIILHCIELAKKGMGYTSPNPMVGCVITKKNKIIAEGYHTKFGAAHAEIEAFNFAKKNRIQLKDASLFVNLEPCSYYGKTPPCVDEIIKNKITKVYIGIKDPNPLVYGNGIKILKAHGIEVQHGILQEECSELNRFYLKYITTGTPYVTLKIAQTLDGKIADEKRNSKWISSLESRKLVHKIRSQYDAVLIGSRTLKIDNSKLTVRYVKGKQPYRVVLDTRLSSPLSSEIFNDRFKNKTIVITSLKAPVSKLKQLDLKGVNVIFCRVKDNKINPGEMLTRLGELGISSVLVEGGAEIFSSFMVSNLADELLIFQSMKIYGKGLDALKLNKKLDLSKAKQLYYHFINTDILINAIL